MAIKGKCLRIDKHMVDENGNRFVLSEYPKEFEEEVTAAIIGLAERVSDSDKKLVEMLEMLKMIYSQNANPLNANPFPANPRPFPAMHPNQQGYGIPSPGTVWCTTNTTAGSDASDLSVLLANQQQVSLAQYGSIGAKLTSQCPSPASEISPKQPGLLKRVLGYLKVEDKSLASSLLPEEQP